MLYLFIQYLEVLMNVMTSAEAAKLWGISQRRVQEYCKDGRIKGAEFIGRQWLFPRNVEKPGKNVGRPRKSTK